VGRVAVDDQGDTVDEEAGVVGPDRADDIRSFWAVRDLGALMARGSSSSRVWLSAVGWRPKKSESSPVILRRRSRIRRSRSLAFAGHATVYLGSRRWNDALRLPGDWGGLLRFCSGPFGLHRPDLRRFPRGTAGGFAGRPPRCGKGDARGTRRFIKTV